MESSKPRGPLSQACHGPGSGWTGVCWWGQQEGGGRAVLTRHSRPARNRRWLKMPILTRLPNVSLGLGWAGGRVGVAIRPHEMSPQQSCSDRSFSPSPRVSAKPGKGRSYAPRNHQVSTSPGICLPLHISPLSDSRYRYLRGSLRLCG